MGRFLSMARPLDTGHLGSWHDSVDSGFCALQGILKPGTVAGFFARSRHAMPGVRDGVCGVARLFGRRSTCDARKDEAPAGWNLPRLLFGDGAPHCALGWL